ncbi:MAG: TonB-dependent receptor plug domain-containing protein [Gammaproteobacteria bacterium]|nr:TonB-dependent receptor plug domain-containing protein [Gammaproteobacteria bacterium]
MNVKLRVARWVVAPVWLAVALPATWAAEPAKTSSVRDRSGVVEEIVVTTRRQEESVQDVPVSVTVFGEEQIEQIKPTTLRDFDGLAPNVYIGMNTAGPGASALFIRGVGYADIEKTQSPQVGVIVDGIQMGSSTGQLVDTFDVASIEINRGPQGVLFGKNTIGGNIIVNRTKPEFNEFGIKVSAESGNYSSQTYKARVNLPIVDDVMALKIGATQRERDGVLQQRDDRWIGLVTWTFPHRLRLALCTGRGLRSHAHLRSYRRCESDAAAGSAFQRR